MSEFLSPEFSLGEKTLGSKGHAYCHDINKGFTGFAKRQVIPRVMAIALPIFTVLDLIYQTYALAIKFTANVLTFTYLGRNEEDFSLSKMREHLEKIGTLALKTLLAIPVGIVAPKFLFSHWEKSELDEFEDRPEEDPFALLKRRLFSVEGDSMATLPTYEAIEDSVNAGSLRQALRDKLDLRMAGHILGDAFIGGSGYEGNAGSTSLEYASLLIKDIQERGQGEQESLRPQSFKPEIVEAVAEELRQCHAHSLRIDSVANSRSNEEFRTLVEDTQRDVRDLDVGSSFLMRTGWADMPSGHAMLMEIKRKSNSWGGAPRYTIHVYNTGAGTSIHKHFREVNQMKFIPVIKYDNVEMDELNPFFFEQLLEANIKPVWDPTVEEHKYDHETFLQILAPLASKKVELSAEESFTTIGQRSGTCSFRSILAFMRHKLNNEDHYKALKLEMGLATLMDMAAKIKSEEFEHPEAAKALVERSRKNMARMLLKRWDPTNNEGICADTVKRAYAILKKIEEDIPVPRAIVTASNKDLSNMARTEFSSQFEGATRFVRSIQQKSVVDFSNERDRPCPLPCLPLTRPQDFTATLTLFNECKRLSAQLMNGREKKAAAAIAAETVLKLPPLTDVQYWNSISSAEAIKTVMDNLLDTIRILITGREMDFGNNRSRDFIAITKAFFLMAYLAKKFDPSLAQYGLDLSYLEKVMGKREFLTVSPELSEEYAAIKTYCTSSFSSGTSSLKKFFSYQNPGREAYPREFPYYFITEGKMRGDGELEYLKNKANNGGIPQEKVQRCRDRLLAVPSTTDPQMVNVIGLFVFAKEENVEELYAYTQLRESYALMRALLKDNYYSKQDASLHGLMECPDYTSKEEVSVAFTHTGNCILLSAEDSEFIRVTKADIDREVINLFSRDRNQRTVNYWDNGYQKETGDVIKFENEIPLQANEAASKRDEAKDIFSSLHKEDLVISSLIQLFQRGDYIGKLGEQSYQEEIFKELFHSGRLMSALDREPLLALQLLKFTKKGCDHYSKLFGGCRIQLQPSLFFMSLAVRLLPFIEKQKVKQSAIALQNGSQSPLEEIDCNALRDDYINRLNTWVERVNDPEEKGAINALIARAHLDAVPKNGPLPEQGTPEYTRLQNHVIGLQKAYVACNYLGMRNEFRSPLFEEEFPEEMMKASTTLAKLLHDPGFRRRTLKAVLSSIGKSNEEIESTLSVEQEGYPKVQGRIAGQKFRVNFLTGAVSLEGGQVRMIPPSFREHEIYKRFFGNRVIGPGTLAYSFYFDLVDQESGLGHIRIESYSDQFRLCREIDGKWYEYASDDSSFSEEEIPTILLQSRLKSRITDKERHLYTHWKRCTSYTGEKTVIVADASGKRLLYKINEDASIKTYDANNTLSEDAVINLNSEIEASQAILATLNNFALSKKAALAIKGEGEQGIKELTFPLYYDEEGRPLSFVRREDGKLAMAFNQEFSIAEDQTMEAFGRGFHNYLLVEDRQGNKKLLVPSTAFKRVDEPFSHSAKLDLSEMEECPYQLFTIDSLGKVQATTTEGFAFLAYYFMAKRDYKMAREYLQRAKSFDRYTPEALKIFMDISTLPAKNFDNTADAKSLRLYANYLVVKNFQECPGKELEEGTLKDFWCGEDACKRILKNYSSHIRHKNNCSRENRFEILIDSPDDEFNFLKGLIEKSERADMHLLMRLSHFDPEARHVTKEEVPFDFLEDWKRLDENGKFFDSLSSLSVDFHGCTHNRSVETSWLFLQETLEENLDRTTPAGRVSSLMKATSKDFLNNLKTYYERVTSSDDDVRKQVRQELLAIGKFSDGDANFLHHFLIFLSNKTGCWGYRDLPSYPANPEAIEQFVGDIANYVPAFQRGLKWKTFKLTICKVAKIAVFIFKHFLTILEAFWKGIKGCLGLPGLMDPTKQVQAVAMRRLLSRMGASWKQAPEKVVRTIEITDPNVCSFDKRPLLHHCQTYFVETIGQAEEIPALIDFSTLPDETPEFTRHRIEKLNEDYSEGCQKNASKARFTFKEGVNPEMLKTTLAGDIERDRARLKELEEQILELANKRDPIWQRQARLELQIDGQQNKRLDIEGCENLFALNDFQAFLDKNPFLVDEDVKALTQKIAEYSLIKIRYQQAHRAKGYLKQYLSIMPRFVDVNRLIEDDSLSSLKKQELKLKKKELKLQITDLQQRVGETLVAKRVYDLMQWRELLIFESRSNKMLWSEQFNLLEKMFATDEDSNNRDIILQLIMGGGKTDVINNIQAYKKADGDSLSVLVVLSSLFNTNKNDIGRKAKDCFGQDSITIRYDRSKECFTRQYIDKLYRRLVEARKKKKLVIVTPATLHFLKHGYFEACDQLDKVLNNVFAGKVQELVLKKELLRKILELFAVKGNFTYDEPHKLFLATHEYNSPMGTGEALDSDSVSMITHVMHRIATAHRELVDIRKGEQYLISDEKYEALRQVLVKELSRYAPIGLPEEHYENFKAYVLGKNDARAQAFKTEMDGWADSQDKRSQKAADLIALSKRLLNGLLKDAFQKRPGVGYGLSQDPESNRGLEIAIPYSGNNRPQEESRIADPFEMVIKTVCKYYDISDKNEATRGLSIKQAREWLVGKQGEAREEIENHGGNLEVNHTEASCFVHSVTGDHLFSIDIYNDRALEPIRTCLNDPDNENATKALNEYLMNHVFLKEKQYPEQINTTGISLGGMPGRGQGYSGTLENSQTFHSRFEISENSGTNGQTIDLLVRQNKAVKVVKSKEPQELLEELLPNAEDPDYHAFIDAGAHFSGYGNLDVAKGFLRFFESKPNSSIKGVMFFDGDRLSLLKRDAKKPIYLNSSEPAAIKQQTNLDPKEYFGYFDDIHTTGADLPLFWKTRAFATIGMDTTKTKKLQGDKRLRGLHKEQRVTTLIPEAVEDSLRRAVGKKNEEITIVDVLTFTEINESKMQLQDNLRSCLQKIRYEMRDYIFQRMIHARNNDDIAMLRAYRELFIDNIEASPWKLFGELNREIPMEEFLEEVKNKYLTLSQKLFNSSEKAEIQAKIEGMIREYEGSLPSLVKSPLSHANRTMEQQVQQEVNRQEEREEEKERAISGLSGLTVMKTVKWNIEDIYQANCFEPISARRVRGALNRKSSLDPNKPTLFRLKDLIANDSSLESFTEVFEDNIIVSENLIRGLLEKPAYLSGYLAKGMYQTLAIRENGQWKFVFLSVQDAAYFQNALAEQRMQTGTGNRQMWLLASNGEIIQQGRDRLTDAFCNEEGFKLGVVQALAFKGDYQGLSRYSQSVRRWAERSHAQLKSSFVRTRISPSLLKRFDRSPLHAALCLA